MKKEAIFVFEELTPEIIAFLEELSGGKFKLEEIPDKLVPEFIQEEIKKSDC